MSGKFFEIDETPTHVVPVDRNYCGCAEQTKFSLNIDCGDIHVECIHCGRMPEWMEDFSDCLQMADILVTIRDTNVPGKNCGCNFFEQLEHDCGPDFVVSVQKPEITLQCPDPEPHGPHVWLLENRVPAACPGK